MNKIERGGGGVLKYGDAIDIWTEGHVSIEWDNLTTTDNIPVPKAGA